MTTSNSSTQPRKRSRLLYILGGCSVIVLCLVGALAVNSAYWIIKMRTAGGTGAQPQEVVQASYESLPEGDAGRGEAVFNGEGSCSGCHSLEAGEHKAGPSLAGIADRVTEDAPDQDPEVYLYESIVHPNAVVANGFPAGVMPENYGKRLSEQEIADLIAFLREK